MTIYIRVSEASRLSWTQDMGQLCEATEKTSIQARVNLAGVFGDFRHDYLRSDSLVIFTAGSAITTFMALVKAIAAQRPSPSVSYQGGAFNFQLYLVCTFRTQSELAAYGQFLHQVTQDPRFTSWIYIQIFVTRAKGVTSPTQAAEKQPLKNMHGLNSSLMALSMDPRSFQQDVFNRSDGSGSSTPTTAVFPSPYYAPEVDLSSPIPRHRYTPRSLTTPPPPTNLLQHQQVQATIATFQSASADTVARMFALLDLGTSAFMVIVPLAFYYAIRTVQWEGSPHYCPYEYRRVDGLTVFVCRWTFALLPDVFHFLAMVGLGYLGAWIARKIQRRQDLTKYGQQQQQSAMGDFDLECQQAATMVEVEDVEVGQGIRLSLSDDWSSFGDGDRQAASGEANPSEVAFTPGRMDARQVILRFKEMGVGCHKNNDTVGDEEMHMKGTVGGNVTVRAGGPEGFIDMIERQVGTSRWEVDFRRETWAP
ncbi:hypothetical protein BGW39_001738 [Mortierella sp. 14UC]|nr:hypothetical protein BGW39_001738 [Mortierella sp. 14UC]